MSIGPIQFLAITFQDYQPDTGVLSALGRATDAGAVRLIDLQFVRKNHAGKITTMEMSGLSSNEKAELGSVIGGLLNAGVDADETAEEFLPQALAELGQSYGLGLGDIRKVAEEIRPGCAAALFVIEHTWAIEFSDALRKAGGQTAAQGFLTREAVVMVGKEVQALSDAAQVVELSKAIQQEAAFEAADAIMISEAIQSEAARHAAEALSSARADDDAATDDEILT